MRTFTNDYDTVRCFDLKVWKQERNLIFFHHDPSEATAETVKLYSNLHGSSSSPMARYALDSNDEAIIDVSDYIRANPTVARIIVECAQDSPISIPLQVVGLISPDRLLIPPMTYELPDYTEAVLKVAAPKVIYQSSLDHLVEFRGENIYDDQNSGIGRSHGGYPERMLKEGSNGVPSSWPALAVTIEQEEAAYIPIRQVPCDQIPACVEWVGVTGARKRATWLVSRHSIESADSVALMPVVSDYRGVKGRAEGLTIYLDGLTDYDLWYYSDVLTSSDVRVLIGDEITAGNLTGGHIDERFTVEVATKSVTVPDGNAGDLTKFEVQLNWRKYDAVNM